MIGLLPWEKWLPPWLYGPLLTAGSVYFLWNDNKLHWWEYAALACSAIMGVWATWVWFKTGRNIFK